ncbi:MAG: transposase [Candidatus Tenebribacter mawsonii]|nr:transposase [Candidatus Tenebribacter mawsonii]
MHCSKDLYQKGSCFHFYNRVVDGEFLFIDHHDYLTFLSKFRNSMERYPLSVFAYCLMPNHFHFFIRQNSEIAIYQIFNSVLSSYVQKYNLKYQRKGALMGGPLQSIEIADDQYVLNLCSYIHLNPVKAKMVLTAKEWEYSNYSEWIGIKNGKSFDPSVFELYNITMQKYKQRIENYQDEVESDKFKRLLFDNEREINSNT